MQAMKLPAFILAILVGTPSVWSLAEDAPGASKADAAATQAKAPESFGNGFLPHEVTVFEQSAMDHALLLKYYADKEVQVPADVLKRHLEEIRRNLAAAQDAYAKLGKPESAGKGLRVHVTEVEGTMQTCEEHCQQMTKELDAKTKETEAWAKQAEQLYEQIRSSQQSHYRVMRGLGVQRNYYDPRMDINRSYDPENMNTR